VNKPAIIAALSASLMLVANVMSASAHSMFGQPPAPGVNVCDEMQPGPHILMTPTGQARPADVTRAASLVVTAQAALAKYTDVNAAQADGYAYDGPSIPKSIESYVCYHFTNPDNAYAEQFGFDPTTPTSLLYARINGIFQLQGVMYTAPLSMSPDEVDARVPAKVWPWHQHVDVCEQTRGDFDSPGAGGQFGLAGSIQTADACAAAGGYWAPHVYAWMDHVLFPWATGGTAAPPANL